MRKTLFSTLLVLAMLLSMLGLDAGKVSAAATLSFSNVHLSSDGILTWDPISNPGTTCCWISFHTDKMTRTYDAGNGRCDLNKILIDNKFESGTYPVTLEQHDADSNKYEWKSSYTFVNPNPLTRMPQATNIRWEGDAIVWD